MANSPAQSHDPGTVSSHIEKLRTKLGGPFHSLPAKSTVSLLMKHGGFQILTKSGAVMTRLKRHLPDEAEDSLAKAAVAITQTASMFFQRLLSNGYAIPVELISWITFPHEGTTYTELSAPEAENPKIPAVFTFVGQFIDHDLTFNGANLFDDQTGADVPDFASPTIDLDSVYGGRTYPNNKSDPSLKGIVDHKDVFHPDMRFRLVKLGPNAYDLTRWEHAAEPGRLGQAYIFDPRNDENQIVLQVHLLVMRVHNKIIEGIYHSTGLKPDHKADAHHAANLAQAEVIANWQSVILNDYLPLVCQADILSDVLKNIQMPGHGNLKYKPAADGSIKMPHEFAIAFRFGHSMLRTAYHLNSGGDIQLFNNRDLDHKGDLRGGRPLTLDHVIDWNVFYPKGSPAPPSLQIDSKITSVVFDLPESTIPDNVKTVGNLPLRNLTRSREIDLSCGEDLADFFGIEKLTPAQVEPNEKAHYLYEADVNIYPKPGGVGERLDDLSQKGYTDTRFKTPFWYYILKEAEINGKGQRLGALGSRIIAEVICGGIFYGTDTKFDYNWKSKITGTNVVTLRDLIDFVLE